MNAEREMDTADGLGGERKPSDLARRMQALIDAARLEGEFELAEALTAAWYDCQRREAERYDRSKVDAFDNAHGLDR